MKTVKLYLNYAGFCWASRHHALQGSKKEEMKFHALWGLIQHPEKGWILYDTGYTQRFYEATQYFPNKIYALATKVAIKPEEEVAAQLSNYGIDPLEIKHVIITHFHADHVAGLKDFPNATFYASSTALKHVLKQPRITAFSKGILKDLIPTDLEKRTHVIDVQSKVLEDAYFGHKYDLFGDNSLYVYDLPGHAAGQIGIMLATQKQRYFLVADACWLKESYEHNALPSPVVKLFFDSWKDFKNTLSTLHHFHQQVPDVVIVPTHCEETGNRLIQSEINMDVL